MKWALTISLSLHIAFIAFVAYISTPRDVPLGDGTFMSVDVFSSPQQGDDNAPTAPSKLLQPARPKTPSYTKSFSTPQKDESERPGGTSSGESTGLKGGSGPAGESGSPAGNPILAKIRTKIERVKYYPAVAKRQRLTGTPIVSFQIDTSGMIRSAKLERSSGIDILDSAALETIKRAAPLPYFASPMTVSIKYTLSD